MPGTPSGLRRRAGRRGSTPAGRRPGRSRSRMAPRLRKITEATAGLGAVALVPAGLLYAGGRWLWRKARPGKPAVPLRAATRSIAVRPRPATSSSVSVPGGTPKSASPLAATRPPAPRFYVKGPSIMNKIDAASEAVLSHIGGFEPQNAHDLDAFLGSLPDFFNTVGAAFRQVASRLGDGYPVDSSISDRLNDIGSTIAGMADFSGEAHGAHRARHEHELHRIENPRVNEPFWDVSRNDS
jgi:hypothetical protein